MPVGFSLALSWGGLRWVEVRSGFGREVAVLVFACISTLGLPAAFGLPEETRYQGIIAREG